MLTKKDDYEPLEKQLAGFMRVLAHPARMAIMIRLAQSQKCVDGNVINDLPLEEASAFQHLKALEKAGLIKGTTTTVRSNYCINWDAFWAFSDNFKQFFKDFGENANKQICLSKTTGKLLQVSWFASSIMLTIN